MENESHPDNTFRAKHQHRTFPVAKHPNAPPAWMLNLRAIIVNQALSMSARLFALKIVMHRPTVFAPFAVSLPRQPPTTASQPRFRCMYVGILG
jgi:hypothetical protein